LHAVNGRRFVNGNQGEIQLIFRSSRQAAVPPCHASDKQRGDSRRTSSLVNFLCNP
jgi:hypothetical protein